jgi:hypothetical protein
MNLNLNVYIQHLIFIMFLRCVHNFSYVDCLPQNSDTLPGRRRKVRCIFLPDSHTCLDCSRRKTQCVIRHADKTSPEDEKVTLRERIRRLESLLAETQDREPNNSHQDSSLIIPSNTPQDFDLREGVEGADRRAPFVALLNDAEVCFHIGLHLDDLLTLSAILIET